MDADEFHERSLKINVPMIKAALKTRFRSEQIARLGNVHIIYPAFNKESFRRIIALELDRISNKVKSHQKVEIQFDQSIQELIYKEGVYPTQGTRPIFTTVHQLVSTKLGRVFTEMYMKGIDVTKIVFRTAGNVVYADYFNKVEKVNSLSMQQPLMLENLRKSKCDDLQSITAVHEAGHALISILLLRVVPEVLYSNSTEPGISGVTLAKFKWKYISRKEILSRIAFYLGGHVAESLVFGDENVTTGSESDIETATAFSKEMLNQCGMGRYPVDYQLLHQARNFVYDKNGRLCDEAEGWIVEANELAKNTIKEQLLLLLKIADYLSDHRQMSKEQIIHYIKKYASNFDSSTLIENGDLLFYRNRLKEQVAALDSGNLRLVSGSTIGIVMNKCAPK
jgi:hypothetical protein